MTSIKIVLRQKKGKDNTFPLAIRITKDRKTSFIHVGHDIKQSEWDADNQRVKKSHPNSTRLNNYLLAKLAEANDKALTLETATDHVTARTVKQKIKPTGGGTFFAQAKIYLDDLYKAGNYNVYNADKPRIKRFRAFLDNSDIAFADITVTLLKRFILYLKTCHTLSSQEKTKTGKPAKSKKPMADRTITNHLIVIRTIINDAIEAKIHDSKNYPFGKDGISINLTGGLKIGLTSDEVKTLESLDLSDSPKEDHARNVWLVSFYFAGVRAGDTLLLMRCDFQNGRLYYSMNKNSKADSLKVSEKVINIIERYQAMNNAHGLLFPELSGLDDLNNKYEVQRITSYADKNLNKHLRRVAEKAGIDKKLTMHIARHTFGNIAGDKIPVPMLQKLYRHSDIATTIRYQQNFIHKATDEALEAVTNF